MMQMDATVHALEWSVTHTTMQSSNVFLSRHRSSSARREFRSHRPRSSSSLSRIKRQATARAISSVVVSSPSSFSS